MPCCAFLVKDVTAAARILQYRMTEWVTGWQEGSVETPSLFRHSQRKRCFHMHSFKFSLIPYRIRPDPEERIPLLMITWIRGEQKKKLHWIGRRRGREYRICRFRSCNSIWQIKDLSWGRERNIYSPCTWDWNEMQQQHHHRVPPMAGGMKRTCNHRVWENKFRNLFCILNLISIFLKALLFKERVADSFTCMPPS